LQVVVYLSGDPVHDRVLKAFYEGCPLKKEYRQVTDYVPSDIAVIFGVYKSKVPKSFPRGNVFRQQRAKNLDVIVLETGYINRGDGENHHYAAGFNGLNGRADFKNRGMSDDRYIQLASEFPVQTVLKPYCEPRETGHILLCGQVPWDASVDHIDYVGWLNQTATRLKEQTRRKIVFRPHPLAKIPPIEGCEYSTVPIWEDMVRATAVVTFNSNSGVEALINGVPVFAFDEGSMVWSICNKDLRRIDFPETPPRQRWLNDLCYAQWTLKEMMEGKAWSHLFRDMSSGAQETLPG
jgi:hypothetical protein